MAEKKRAMNTAAYVILILGALLILFPLYITVVTTFKTSGESANSFFTLPQSIQAVSISLLPQISPSEAWCRKRRSN